MPVILVNNPEYFCVCDICNKAKSVKKDKKAYNGAQAVRMLKWSFGKDRRVICINCRQKNYNDNYR